MMVWAMLLLVPLLFISCDGAWLMSLAGFSAPSDHFSLESIEFNVQPIGSQLSLRNPVSVHILHDKSFCHRDLESDGSRNNVHSWPTSSIVHSVVYDGKSNIIPSIHGAISGLDTSDLDFCILIDNNTTGFNVSLTWTMITYPFRKLIIAALVVNFLLLVAFFIQYYRLRVIERDEPELENEKAVAPLLNDMSKTALLSDYNHV